MSFPHYVFLDTNVFDSQTYNYQSVALKSFVNAVQAKGGIKLLLPDPIEQEIHRHIAERSVQALEAVNKVRREVRRVAPFLAQWEHYPEKAFSPRMEQSVIRLGHNEWANFISQFDVQRLGYEGVDPATVMGWYDATEPPFGTARKKSEFPDAFAVAILDKFAAENGCVIAVVSQDPDMKLACERRTSFFYFIDLAHLTEVLVAGEHDLAKLRESILHDLGPLESALRDKAATAITYYHVFNKYEVVDTNLENVKIEDVRIVGLRRDDATLAFTASVKASHAVRWYEQDWRGDMGESRTTLAKTHAIHGAAKVRLDAATQRISAVTFISLEESRLQVNRPPEEWRRGWEP